MQIYNVKEGKHHKTLLSQKYGVSHAMFGHAPGCIIHSSTKLNRKLPNIITKQNSEVLQTQSDTSQHMTTLICGILKATKPT
jgi:hypothetical protein